MSATDELRPVWEGLRQAREEIILARLHADRAGRAIAGIIEYSEARTGRKLEAASPPVLSELVADLGAPKAPPEGA